MIPVHTKGQGVAQAEKTRGITLLLVILVLGSLLSISLGIFSVVLAEIRLSGELTDSFRALYMADRGMEKLLYLDRVADALCPPYDPVSGTYPPCPPHSNGLIFPMDIGPLANGDCVKLNIFRAANQVTVSSVGERNCAVSDISVKRSLFARYTKDTASGFPTPVGFWKFDEGSGAVANDSSGVDNTGSLVSSPAWVAGKVGTALTFNGLNTYVNVPDNPTGSLDPTAISITAWVRIPSAPVLSGNIVSKGNNGGYRFRINNSRTVTWFDRGATNAISSVGTVPLNTWIHIAVVGGPSGLKIYINGVLDGSNGAPYAAPNTPSSLKIGSEPAFNEYFLGTIDEVRVYNAVLNPTQIQAIMSSP